MLNSQLSHILSPQQSLKPTDDIDIPKTGVKRVRSKKHFPIDQDISLRKSKINRKTSELNQQVNSKVRSTPSKVIKSQTKTQRIPGHKYVFSQQEFQPQPNEQTESSQFQTADSINELDNDTVANKMPSEVYMNTASGRRSVSPTMMMNVQMTSQPKIKKGKKLTKKQQASQQFLARMQVDITLRNRDQNKSTMNESSNSRKNNNNTALSSKRAITNIYSTFQNYPSKSNMRQASQQRSASKDQLRTKSPVTNGRASINTNYSQMILKSPKDKTKAKVLESSAQKDKSNSKVNKQEKMKCSSNLQKMFSHESLAQKSPQKSQTIQHNFSSCKFKSNHNAYEFEDGNEQQMQKSQTQRKLSPKDFQKIYERHQHQELERQRRIQEAQKLKEFETELEQMIHLRKYQKKITPKEEKQIFEKLHSDAELRQKERESTIKLKELMEIKKLQRERERAMNSSSKTSIIVKK